jgi:hypothetical protein
MFWIFIAVLEQIEAAAAAAHLISLSSAACHLAMVFGMLGPCQ